MVLSTGLLFEPGTAPAEDPTAAGSSAALGEDPQGPQQGVSQQQEGAAPEQLAPEVAAPDDSDDSDYAASALAEVGVKPPRMDGYLTLRTQSRWAVDRDVDDHDLYGVMGVNYFTGGDSEWGLHLMMRGGWGLNEQDPDSIFYGVQDTYKNQLEGRIYHAYADAPVGGSMGLVRFGRMLIYETPVTIYVDGVQVETEPAGLTEFTLGAYGGSSVHQFEDWPSDELLGGVYTRFRPWEDGLLRIDYLHLDDDARYPEGENDLVSADLLHLVGDDLRLKGNFSLLDGKSNDLRLGAFWLWPEADLTLRFTYYQLLEAQADLAHELNPFYNFLNTYYPYTQTQFVLSKSFSEVLELYGGLDFRRVEDEGDIGRYNRDFDRYYLTVALPELLPLRTTLSLTGEVWDSPDNDIESWGLDLSSRLSEDTKLSLGSYYSLYKYYFDVNAEREDVRTIYGELRNSLSDSMNVMARYEYEDEDLDSFHSLRLGVTWRF